MDVEAGRVEVEVESKAVDGRAVVCVAGTVLVDAEEVAVLVSSDPEPVAVVSATSGFFSFVLVVVFVVGVVEVRVAEVSFVTDAFVVVDDFEVVLVEVDAEVGGG